MDSVSRIDAEGVGNVVGALWEGCPLSSPSPLLSLLPGMVTVDRPLLFGRVDAGESSEIGCAVLRPATVVGTGIRSDADDNGVEGEALLLLVDDV